MAAFGEGPRGTESQALALPSASGIRAPVSPFVRVWTDATYRAYLLLMVMLSFATSCAIPLVALFMVRDLGVSLSAAGFFFICVAVPGFLLGIVLGRMSDRWESRRPFALFATAWLGLGWLLLAAAPTAWLALSIGAVFLSFSGILSGQLYAALHAVMQGQGEPQPGVVNSIVRTGWSLGFVFGPVAGALLADVLSLRASFVAAALLFVLCLPVLYHLPLPTTVAVRMPEDSGRLDLLPLAFALLCALAISGSTIKNTYLPIYVTTHLGRSVADFGVLIAVSPIVEVVAMPLSGLLAERLGVGRMLGAGLVIGAVEYLLIGSSNAYWQLFVTQTLDACLIAVLLGLGVTYIQRLTPSRPGAASSLFYSAMSLSNVLGGLIGGAAVPLLGLPHIFFLPAVFCLLTWAALPFINRAARA